MIIKLNTDGTITIEPRRIPEPLENIYIAYKFPKGLNHLKPVLNWGGVIYEGQNKHIKKSASDFEMKVTLYSGTEIFKEYKGLAVPQLFLSYHVDDIEPDLLAQLRRLEQENKELKERGEIV
jgi:hypothetical protein